MLSFEWNKDKARRNARKHGITFDEALSVFFDENAVQFWDDEHSGDESRYILLGLSSKLRLLVVVHTEREHGRVIRIISARRATPSERRHYRTGRR